VSRKTAWNYMRAVSENLNIATESPSRGEALKERVRAFWNGAPCGFAHAGAPEGTREFFDQVERRRDELEPFIPLFADFAGARGKRVLEIGVGLGTDFVRFGRSGATLTGIDLTEHAVELVRRRLELEGLSGDVRVADAEKLPFEDASFDRVYSWGVLHHTPDTRRAVEEAVRVLRPGGELCVMLYGRRSWVAYGMWIRNALLRGRPWWSISDVLARYMESEGTKAFTRDELRALFSSVDNLRIDSIATPYDRSFAGPAVALTGNRLGWFVVIRGTRPSTR
jgi:SAM-dependent methyltransferase